MTLAFRWFESNYPSQNKKTTLAVVFLFWLINGRTRKAGPEKALNGLFPAVAFPQKSESNGRQDQNIFSQQNLNCGQIPRHTPSEAFQKSFPFKKYLQSHRCNSTLDRFGLTKAFLREEGGTRQGFPEANEMSFGGSLRSVTEGACATLKSDETLLQRALPQSPTAPAPSRREPLRESLPKYLKCLQSCAIIKPRKAVAWMPDQMICPFCGVDALLPDNKIHLSTNLLADMCQVCFNEPYHT